MVKLWDTEIAAEQCRGLFGPYTAVLSMQNGVDPGLILSRILGSEHFMGAVAEVGANIVQPDFIRRFSPSACIRFGELDFSRSSRADHFLTPLSLQDSMPNMPKA